MPIRLPAALAFLLILLAAHGCRAPAPTAAAPAAAAGSDRSGWVRRTLSEGWRDVPPYSLEVPPWLERIDVQGIDSDASWLTGPDLDLHFDYGMYGGFGDCPAGARCTGGEAVIGGKPARTLAVARAAPDDEGRRLSYSVEVAVIPAPRPGPTGIDLVAHAQCRTEAACRDAAAMLASIEFRSAGPVMPKTKAAPTPAPQPEAPQAQAAAPPWPCTRVGAAEARGFEGLAPLGTAPGWQVFGRREAMTCTAAGADGRAECRVRGPSEVRIEMPRGTSGFRISTDAVLTFGGSGFGCGPPEPGRGLSGSPPPRG